MMALRDGKLVYALGLPGGKQIFPSAMQALVNLIDHGMSLQEAVEAPRVWTEGNALEVEHAVPDSVRAKLDGDGPQGAGDADRRRRHERHPVSRRWHGCHGAACWRADGSPVAIAGGLARAGVRFGLA